MYDGLRKDMHTLQNQCFHRLDKLKDVEWNLHVCGMKGVLGQDCDLIKSKYHTNKKHVF